MKNIVLFATALLLGTASAANVSGSQTTPLTLKVNNYCQLASVGTTVPATFSRTNAPVDLGTINAITNHKVDNVLVASVDCNLGTALNVTTPSKVTMKSGNNSFDITTDTWDAQHPLTMSFNKLAGFSPDHGYGKYDYHAITASFHVGGSPTIDNRAWSIPGGNYKGDLVVTYSYDE